MARITLVDFLTNYIPLDGELGTEAVFQRSLELLKNEVDDNGVVIDILTGINAPVWDSGTTYLAGDYVYWGTYNYHALAGSLNSEPLPDGTNTDWEVVSWDINGSGGGEIVRHDYVATSGQTNFLSPTTLTSTPAVYVEGVLTDVDEYSVLNETTVQFNIGLTEGVAVSIFTATPTPTEVVQDERFVATGGQTDFVTSFEMVKAAVYVNGVLQDSNYTVAPQLLSFDDGLVEGDVVVVYSTIPVTNSLDAGPTETDFDASIAQTSFIVNYLVGAVQVFVNGLKLRGTDFDATNGTSIIIPLAVEGDWVQVVAFRPVI